MLPSSFPLIRMFQNPRYQEKTCIPALAKYLTIDFLPSVAAELNAVHRKLLHAPRDAAPDIAPALYMQDLVGLMGEMVDCSVCVVSAVSDTVRCGIHTCKPLIFTWFLLYLFSYTHILASLYVSPGSFSHCIRFIYVYTCKPLLFTWFLFLIVFVSYTCILVSLCFSRGSFFSLYSFSYTYRPGFWPRSLATWRPPMRLCR